MYLEGIGTEKNEKSAAEWFDKAAQQNHMMAQLSLAVLYERGLGTPIDIALARKWYKEAASQGFDKAIEKLKN